MLSGGNALGAYHAGAWSVLEEAGVIPARIVGTSIGAITAAVIAGNQPGTRDAALQRFWHSASTFDPTAALPAAMRQPAQYMQAFASRLLGRPPLFTLRLPDLTGSDPRPSVFSVEPMRALVRELVDFDRLNSGEMRVTIVATDLACGEEVVFDTRAGRIELDHVMASAALIPDFPPVKVAGRLLVDGGLCANLPLHLVLEQGLDSEDAERLVCFAVDLFPLAAPLPRGVLQAAQRQNDLLYASQTSRTLSAMTRAWLGRQPGADIFLLTYEALKEESAIKGFDFSAGTLAQRRMAGRRDMRRQIERWRTSETGTLGLSLHGA